MYNVQLCTWCWCGLHCAAVPSFAQTRLSVISGIVYLDESVHWRIQSEMYLRRTHPVLYASAGKLVGLPLWQVETYWSLNICSNWQALCALVQARAIEQRTQHGHYSECSDNSFSNKQFPASTEKPPYWTALPVQALYECWKLSSQNDVMGVEIENCKKYRSLNIGVQ